MQRYLQKHALFPKLIENSPQPDLQIIIVIPCYKEPSLINSLEALKKCEPTACSVEVVIVINAGEDEAQTIKDQNEITYNQALKWSQEHASAKLNFYPLLVNDLPKKHAGVGLARKIGMDEAVRRFSSIGQPKGVIVCFDADSLCDTNYLTAIESHFRKHPEINACSIHFEHPVSGDLEPEIYEAIIKYELFLRYHIQAQRFAGFPYAYQTIGSSMAVRAAIYTRQGGMNRRQAGEDFYFLHKLIPLGNYSVLTSTKVIPSPRASDRVPFGTGKAVNEYLHKSKGTLTAYHFQIYKDLKILLEQVNLFYEIDDPEKVMKKLKDLPESISAFINQNHFEEKLKEIKENTTSVESFRKRFFQWFNAFMVLKYIHFARDLYYPNQPVELVAAELLKEIAYDAADNSPLGLLKIYRERDLVQH